VKQKVLRTEFGDELGSYVITYLLPSGMFHTEATYRHQPQGSYYTENTEQAFKAHELSMSILWEVYFRKGFTHVQASA